MPFSGGSGTSGDPYQIADLTALQFWNENWLTYVDKYFILTANIDATATSGWNAGAGWIPVGTAANPFTGNFDGDGKIITGIFITETSGHTGFFGYLNNATINRLGLIAVNITGTGNVGGLVGLGLVAGIISDCYSTGTVINSSTSNGSAGGLCATFHGTISQSYSTCDITSGVTYNGGFCGYSHTGTFLNCYASGDVTATVAANKIAGGFWGGTIASGTANFTNCYSMGIPSVANTLGGFSGSNLGTGNITNCFWDTQTSGQVTSDGGTGKTTTQMKQEATFTNWNFSTIWIIEENVSYPALLPRTSISGLCTPAYGTTSGGTNVVITGHGFTGATDVKFNGVSAYSFEVISDSTINAITPKGTKGLCDVVVVIP